LAIRGIQYELHEKRIPTLRTSTIDDISHFPLHFALILRAITLVSLSSDVFVPHVSKRGHEDFRGYLYGGLPEILSSREHPFSVIAEVEELS